MMDDEMELSASGQARRERILRLALTEAGTRRRRRQFTRAAAFGIGVLVISAIFASRRAVEPAPHPVATHQTVQPSMEETPTITYLQTDPAIVERLAIRPGSASWKAIGDDELLEALADAGQPAGLVYQNGRTILLPR